MYRELYKNRFPLVGDKKYIDNGYFTVISLKGRKKNKQGAKLQNVMTQSQKSRGDKDQKNRSTAKIIFIFVSFYSEKEKKGRVNDENRISCVKNYQSRQIFVRIVEQNNVLRGQKLIL